MIYYDIIAYTDGACKGNPGIGGWGVILVSKEGNKELFGAEANTTNNRMELMALIIALEELKTGCKVVIYSDSKYLLDAYEKKWIKNWKANGWKTKAKTDVKNIDLWKKLDSLLSNHQAEFIWVKGHDGHIENTRCDELAVRASKTPPYLIDEIYERDK